MRFIFEKEGKRFEYNIPEGNLIVGRDRKADISIVDNNVSRHHITVVRREDMVMIRDLGSRNGTFINNVRVTEGKINAGDVVRLGNLSLFFDDGAPGTEVPGDLEGFLQKKLEEADSMTPPEGVQAAQPAYPVQGAAPLPQQMQPYPPQPAYQPQPLPGYPQPYPQPPLQGQPMPARPSAREADVISASTLPGFARKAVEFYLHNRTLSLAVLGGVTLALLITAAVSIAFTKPKEKPRPMPVNVYDGFLDEGVGAFAGWTAIFDGPVDVKDEKAEKKKLDKAFAEALAYFEKIRKYVPDRQTADIMINLMEAWTEMPREMEARDWSSVRRYLDELMNHPNVTSRAREFARERMQWINREANSRAQAAYAAGFFAKWKDNGDIETLKTAIEEFKKLARDFAGTPAAESQAAMIPLIIEEFRKFHESAGDRHLQAGEWELAIEAFEKAKPYADEVGLKAMEEKISAARFQIGQASILPEARNMKARGEWQRLLDFLKDVPDSSPAHAEAQSIMKEARYNILVEKVRDAYRRGDDGLVEKMTQDKEFYSDAEIASYRDKSRKIAAALKAGDSEYDKAVAQIRDMTDPVQIEGFDAARRNWTEVRNLESDESNAFVSQAQRRLFDLTDDRIGALYFEKAEALIASNDLYKAREFINLARKYDIRLGESHLRDWKTEAGKKYNTAINLKQTDKDKAREMFRWIVSVLRRGDSDYYEKAERELQKLE